MDCKGNGTPSTIEDMGCKVGATIRNQDDNRKGAIKAILNDRDGPTITSTKEGVRRKSLQVQTSSLGQLSNIAPRTRCGQ